MHGNRWHVVLLLGAVTVAAATTYYLYTAVIFGFWAYHVDSAGRILYDTLESQSIGIFRAPYPPKPNASLEDLRSAIAHLDEAVHWRPDQGLPYKLAFVAHSALGEWEGAAASLEAASTLSDTNSLAKWEVAVPLVEFALQPAANQLRYSEARSDLGNFLLLYSADAALGAGETRQAERSYSDFVDTVYGSDYDSLPGDLLYRYLVAANVSGAEEAPRLMLAMSARDPAFHSWVVSPTMQIPGAQLRLLSSPGSNDATYGKLLGIGGAYGILPWSGRASALVYTPTAATYSIAYDLVHSSPPSVLLKLGVDGRPLSSVELARGDDSVERFTITANLDQGFHTIDLWYENDDVVNGHNRDAVIASIEIEARN